MIELRIQHEGFSSLRITHPGRTIRFDPRVPPADGSLVVVTWTEQENLAGVERAVRYGHRPAVVAAPEVLAWLEERGPVEAHAAPAEVDGIRVELLPYAPIPYANAAEALRKVRSTVLNPLRALRRLAARPRLPGGEPVCAALTLPGGRRLVHLNHALHRGTPPGWLDRAADALGGADWLIVGVDHDEEEAIPRLVGRFGAGRVVVADLVGDVRRQLDLPTRPFAPIVEALRRQGVDAHLLASGASLRFEP